MNDKERAVLVEALAACLQDGCRLPAQFESVTSAFTSDSPDLLSEEEIVGALNWVKWRKTPLSADVINILIAQSPTLVC